MNFELSLSQDIRHSDLKLNFNQNKDVLLNSIEHE